MKIMSEVAPKTLHVSAGARYWEDSTVNGQEDETGALIPFRNGDYWEPVIDIETGKVLNWPEGVIADIHYKVCDDGKYTLKDEKDNIISEIDGYVPKIMYPEGDGFGDYIIMKIDEQGQISKWKPSFKEFEK